MKGPAPIRNAEREPARNDENQVMLIDVDEERPTATRWRPVGIAALLVVLGIGVITAGYNEVGDFDDQLTPRVEVATDGSCVWSGREVSAGLVDIEYVNNSSEAVLVKFAPIIEGATIDDVIAAAPDTGDLGDYEDVPLLVGRGQNTRPVDPGMTTTFKVALTILGD